MHAVGECKCLDVTEAATTDVREVELWPCDGSNQQRSPS
jgi:hypothetical protein